jgi:ribosome biogenesis GTPase / thiamine phosphate phosphatase
MTLLDTYGWNTFFANFNHEYHASADLKIARVISIQGFKYHLITTDGEKQAELSGRLLYGTEPELLPRVGDWVYYSDYGAEGYIVDVFTRINALSRKNPGNPSERQVLAANIDYALVVQGLDRDFNLMRLDRYILQILACDIKPVVVLNKADLIEDQEIYRQEVARLGRDYPVFFCSTFNQSGLNELFEQVLKPLQTHILIGSSGVGKSSLINALKNGSGIKTGSLSHSTHKGRHTTSTRDLFQLYNGSLVIDTPGMREFGIAMEEGTAATGLFPAIDGLANKCRYADCRHIAESGCAVIQAYKNGDLDPKIYQSYLKLMKEQRHFEIKIEDRKRMGKQFGKMVKEAKRYRERYKY